MQPVYIRITQIFNRAIIGNAEVNAPPVRIGECADRFPEIYRQGGSQLALAALEFQRVALCFFDFWHSYIVAQLIRDPAQEDTTDWLKDT